MDDSTPSSLRLGQANMTVATIPGHPCPDPKIHITSDTSDGGIGAILEQNQCEMWQPLSFYSQHLSTIEKCFSEELLAAFLAIHKFQPLIDGHQCKLVTSHKLLIHA